MIWSCWRLLKWVVSQFRHYCASEAIVEHARTLQKMVHNLHPYSSLLELSERDPLTRCAPRKWWRPSVTTFARRVQNSFSDRSFLRASLTSAAFWQWCRCGNRNGIVTDAWHSFETLLFCHLSRRHRAATTTTSKVIEVKLESCRTYLWSPIATIITIKCGVVVEIFTICARFWNTIALIVLAWINKTYFHLSYLILSVYNSLRIL